MISNAAQMILNAAHDVFQVISDALTQMIFDPTQMISNALQISNAVKVIFNTVKMISYAVQMTSIKVLFMYQRCRVQHERYNTSSKVLLRCQHQYVGQPQGNERNMSQDVVIKSSRTNHWQSW